jgi:hypothetical protein
LIVSGASPVDTAPDHTADGEVTKHIPSRRRGPSMR